MKRLLALALIAWVMASSPGGCEEAQSLRIVDCNLEALFDPSLAQSRQSDLKAFCDELRPGHPLAPGSHSIINRGEGSRLDGA